MPPRKKQAVAETAPETPDAMCDNHPDILAAHTTASLLHQAISLCERCLTRIGDHIRLR